VKTPQRLEVIGMILLVLTFAMVVFAATFLFTDSIYQHIGQQPSPFLTFLINTLLGLFFCFSILTVLGRVFGSRQRAMQMGVFGPIIEAMEKIAKGDFKVRLDDTFDDHGIMGKLATSVNTMALELNEMEQMRQEFISNVSHELQSPLTSIRGFAKALRNDHLSAEDRSHYLTIIETETMRLSKLTDNLLKLASLEAEHVKFEPKPYRLDKQIRNLVLASEPQWVDKATDMDVSLEEVTITADEDLLSQVWMNLISNSIKFTPNGGKVCVDLHRQDEHIAFQITDTGIGISDEDQLHIFERFYKADKSRTHTNNGGSGLGLAIAQKIVEMHKGTITVDSKPGAGTTFMICLPAEQ